MDCIVGHVQLDVVLLSWECSLMLCPVGCPRLLMLKVMYSVLFILIVILFMSNQRLILKSKSSALWCVTVQLGDTVYSIVSSANPKIRCSSSISNKSFMYIKKSSGPNKA